MSFGEKKDEGSSSKGPTPKKNRTTTCNACGEEGHIRPNCPHRNQAGGTNAPRQQSLRNDAGNQAARPAQ